MAEKLILIDGYSLLFRAFHALPPLDDGAGMQTNAISGFFMMLFKAVAEEKPTCMAVAFDPHGGTFRHQAYDGYKAGRAAMPDEMRMQIPVAEALLDDMRIPRLTADGYEADDILGTVSLWCEKNGVECVLITGDRDSFQLAGEHTTILYTKRGITDTERVTPAWIREKYDLTPAQLIDLKGLMGDTSDNIPGVPGVGEKTALKLIQKYGSLEETLKRADAEEKGKLRERLIENSQQASFSKYLATIVREVPIEFSPDMCRLSSFDGARPRLEKYKLKMLASRIPDTGTEAERKNGKLPAFAAQEPVAAADIQGFRDFLASCADAKTYALHFGENASVCTEDGRCAYVKLGGDLFDPGVTEEQAASACAELLPNAVPAVHDLHLYSDLSDKKPFDTMLAAYVLNPQGKDYSLAGALQLLGQPEMRSECPAVSVMALSLREKAGMEEDGLTALYETIERPLFDVLDSMEKLGFSVDKSVLAELGESYAKKLEELEAEIYEGAGHPFNILSPKQLGTVLFEEMSMPHGRKTKTGWSTDADVLEELAAANPFCAKVLDYRKYSKFKSTYVDALLKLTGDDGRVHTSFLQVSTGTGRISSKDPNLQNIPIRSEEGREIRRAFVAAPGCVLIDADYSQIELRVLADMSGDENMTDAFRKGQDIHTRTASEVFGVPIDEVTKQMRSNAKAVNFGVVYGISEFGLARNTGISRYQAREFIDTYFARYPGVKAFMNAKVAEGKTQGFVTTRFGRRRYLKELESPNYNIRQFGERAAMNSPIQGTAADIIKLAMVNVDKALRENGYKSRLILQVHDELVIEAPEEEQEAVSKLLVASMEGVCDMNLPLVAEISCGRNLYECK